MDGLNFTGKHNPAHILSHKNKNDMCDIGTRGLKKIDPFNNSLSSKHLLFFRPLVNWLIIRSHHSDPGSPLPFLRKVARWHVLPHHRSRSETETRSDAHLRSRRKAERREKRRDKTLISDDISQFNQLIMTKEYPTDVSWRNLRKMENNDGVSQFNQIIVTKREHL